MRQCRQPPAVSCERKGAKKYLEAYRRRRRPRPRDTPALDGSILLSCFRRAAALVLPLAMNLLFFCVRGMEAWPNAFSLAVFGSRSRLSLIANFVRPGTSPRNNQPELVESLKEGGRSIATGRQRPRDVLVALRCIRIVFSRRGIAATDPCQLCFGRPRIQTSQHVMTVRLSASGVKYQERSESSICFAELQKNLSTTDGIESVGGICHHRSDDTLPNWYATIARDEHQKT